MASDPYRDALAWLYTLEAAKGMDFKLERVALALRNLGNPQTRFAAIHIAGTNGKGSVAAMLHAILHAAGHHVGMYTSPHLVHFTERIRVGEADITEAAVVDLTDEIRAAATAHGIDLTFFEFVTVMALLHFARCGIDMAVVEVGLGGRLDATNVIVPDLSVITSIGLDHEEYLGSTLSAVAFEKAGIIKPGRTVVVGQVPGAAAVVIKECAAAQQAPVLWAGADFEVSASAPLVFRGLGTEVPGIAVRLRGAYQRQNAAVAAASSIVVRRHFRVPDDAIRGGLAAVHWPGRLDVVRSAPVIVLDGAHNADGVAALVRELPGVIGDRPLHLLFGVMRDKRWQPMVKLLAPVVHSVTTTTVLPPRGESPDLLARAFGNGCRVRAVSDPLVGLRELLDTVAEDEAILVTGSLFLVGAVYPSLAGRAVNRRVARMPPSP